MYEEIKTLAAIKEKIKKLKYEQMLLQNALSGASNREFDRLEKNIDDYDEWIAEAEKRKEELEKM